MFEEPLFQDNILPTIYKFFNHYLSYHNWAWQYLAAMCFLYILYKLLMYKNTVTYPPLFPNEKYTFSFSKTTDKLGLFFLLLCFVFYVWGLYSQEMSFFSNYDIRSPYFTNSLQNGITPLWGTFGRFSPIAFADLNIIYALTHNFIIINLYILIQVIILSYLLYKFLTFIPVFKRFLIIGLFLISPAFFGTNNIIFTERMLLIYLTGSLLCLKKFNEQQNHTALWWSIFFINLTIYTKESAILIYLGILVYSFLHNLWHEKIKLTSFFHPIKTMRQMPLETLVFASMAIYACFYLLNVTAISDNSYILSCRSNNLLQITLTYKLELFLIFAATILIFLFPKHSFIENSLIIGTIFNACIIVCLFKLSSTIYANNYYLCLPSLISLIIIYHHLDSKKIIYLLSAFLCIVFIHEDYIIHNSHDGKEYRSVCEFLISNKSDNLSIFIAKHSEYTNSSQWFIRTWSSILKYYFPNKKITLISPQFLQNNSADIELWNIDPLYHPFIYRETPQSGDFYIIKKTDKYAEDLAIIKDMKHEFLYQNKLFEVYKIK